MTQFLFRLPRTSLDCHLLPTIKTPAIKKTRPRVIHVEDVEGGEEQDVDQGETRLGQSMTITTVNFEDHTSANVSLWLVHNQNVHYRTVHTLTLKFGCTVNIGSIP